MADAPASVRMLAADRGFTRLRPAGGGVEFQVYAATAPDGSQVVLRTPVGGRFQLCRRRRARPRPGSARGAAAAAAPRAAATGAAACGTSPAGRPPGAPPHRRTVRPAGRVRRGAARRAARRAADRRAAVRGLPAFWVYRLDTAVMLALLFTSEVPQDGRGPRAIDRLREVHQRLSRELDK
jgi:hypothetical protein